MLKSDNNVKGMFWYTSDKNASTLSWSSLFKECN